MDPRDKIIQRLEYLDYLRARMRASKPVLKFKEWTGRTLEAISELHSKIHVRSRRLKQTIRDLYNG